MKDKFSIVIPIGIGRKAPVLDSIKKLKEKPQILLIEGSNPPRNRNEGIKKSKGEFIGFLNAHSTIKKDWIAQTRLFFKKNSEIDIVGGPQLTSKEEGIFGRASGEALNSKFGSAAISKRYKPSKESLDADETMITSANLICRKRVFDKTRFDENIYPGEDPKFIEDAKSAGFKVAYSPRIQVYNFRRTNLKGLAKQIFNYGKTRPQKEGLLKTIKKPFFLVPSLFVIYLLALSFLWSLSSFFIIPLYLYLVLVIAFSLRGAIRNKSIFFIFLLPFIFITIHLSYGVGFIIGSLWKK